MIIQVSQQFNWVSGLYTWRITLYGSEAWTLRKLEQKYLERFEMWYWRKMEKIKWSDKVTNEQVLERIGEKRTLRGEF